MRALRAIAIVVGVVFVVLIASSFAIKWWNFRPRQFTFIQRTLPGGDVISISLTKRGGRLHLDERQAERLPWWVDLYTWWLDNCGHPCFEYLLTWQHRGDERTYLLSEVEWPSEWVELRARPDWTGVWVVYEQSDHANILGSLDLTTGQCWDWKSWPLGVREGDTTATRYPCSPSEVVHPTWATPDGGVLLGRFTGDPSGGR